MLTLRKIVLDGQFESDFRALLRKSNFLFGDSIEEDEAVHYDGDYKWLCQIGNKRFFLLNMERIYPLAYLQHMSVHQTMDWELVKTIFRVSLGKIGDNDVYTVGHGREVLGLVRAKYPKGDSITSSHLHQTIPRREG